MKMTKNIRAVMKEAYRRNHMAEVKGCEKHVGERWLGLGTASEYKSAVDSGLFRWIGLRPAPRCDGWLRLTTKGITLLVKHAHEFHVELEKEGSLI